MNEENLGSIRSVTGELAATHLLNILQTYPDILQVIEIDKMPG